MRTKSLSADALNNTLTIELGFENDASVEAWFISDGIVSKGQAVDESYNVGMQCKNEDVANENCQDTPGVMSSSVSTEQGDHESRGRRSWCSRQRHDKV